MIWERSKVVPTAILFFISEKYSKG
uniref:Uncharacterized protein n=1 Tax=Anopheles dirus TaxID=7168 RepID=A0A182NX30_9DIPT